MLLDVWWAELLAYGTFPLLVCFAILYGSHWHREMGRLPRILFMILSSCIILCCALFGGVAIIVGLFVVVNRFTAFHY